MFIAKFQQVTSDHFTSDKNGNMPFIGEIMAGTSKGAIFNGTMFIRDGMEANKLYACENFIDPEFPTKKDGITPNYQTRMIAEVSIKDFLGLRTELGEGKNNFNKAEEAAKAPSAPVEAELESRE